MMGSQYTRKSLDIQMVFGSVIFAAGPHHWIRHILLCPRCWYLERAGNSRGQSDSTFCHISIYSYNVIFISALKLSPSAIRSINKHQTRMLNQRDIVSTMAHPTYNPQTGFRDGHSSLQIYSTSMAHPPSTPTQAIVPQLLQLHIPAAPVGMEPDWESQCKCFSVDRSRWQSGWFILQDLRIPVRYVPYPLYLAKIHGENRGE